MCGVANRSDAVGRAGALVPRQGCRVDVWVRTLDAGTPKNRVFTGLCNDVLAKRIRLREAFVRASTTCISVLRPSVHTNCTKFFSCGSDCRVFA